MEELNEITSFCSPSVVKHLMLKDVAPPLNFESLLDGLFWTCHPESLSVESMWGRSDEFMQVNVIFLSFHICRIIFFLI